MALAKVSQRLTRRLKLNLRREFIKLEAWLQGYEKWQREREILEGEILLLTLMNLSCKVNGCARVEIMTKLTTNGLFTFPTRFRKFAMKRTRQRNIKRTMKWRARVYSQSQKSLYNTFPNKTVFMQIEFYYVLVCILWIYFTIFCIFYLIYLL